VGLAGAVLVAASPGRPVQPAGPVSPGWRDDGVAQVLQPVRPAMPGCPGDRLAGVIVQLHQQPAHHLAAALPGLPPGKAPGHPPQQIRQQRRPSIIRHGASSDCRIVIVSRNPS
jgi:hypothetical protein